MSKYKILFTITCILTVISLSIVGTYIYLNKPQQFLLIKESGKIEIKGPDQSEYQSLDTIEKELPTGTFIRTNADSFARVFLPDNSLISIDQKTEIQINLEGKKIDIQQLVGNTWNRVQTVTKGGEFTITTPTSIAAVRGTTFGVNVPSKNESNILVRQHTVNVSSLLETKTIENIDVQEGEHVWILRDGDKVTIKREQVSENNTDEFWLERNHIIDIWYQEFLQDESRNPSDFILDKLMKESNYNNYRFGLPSDKKITKEGLDSQLMQVKEITNVTKDTCQKYSQSEFFLAIDKVEYYRTYIGNAEGVLDFLSLIKDACFDGTLNSKEAQDLSNLSTDINNEIP